MLFVNWPQLSSQTALGLSPAKLRFCQTWLSTGDTGGVKRGRWISPKPELGGFRASQQSTIDGTQLSSLNLYKSPVAD